jgi:aryl-phospho-beta-D-glucosidase BglC (GH1 family)
MRKAILLILWWVMSVQAQDIFELNERLGRGVNFGNALEAPSEGAWGMTLETSFFDLVKEAGFDTIRLPVSWTTHASKETPYTIDAAYIDRVQWAVDEATKRDLNIIVNIHHYDELNKDPVAEEERYLALWGQIAERFKDYPKSVYFELLNEPHDAFNSNAELWNNLLVKALNVVRKTNPDRAVIIGPTNWNAISSLSGLVLPDDPNIIVTVHFYDPFEFTHQGAEWTNPSPPVGTLWTGGNRRFSPRWDNKFADTEAVFVKEAASDKGNEQEYLQVKFAGAESAYRLHSYMKPKGFTHLALKTTTSAKVRVVCNETEGIDVTTTANTETLVDLSSCLSEGLSDFELQNASTEAQSFLIETLEFRGEGKVLVPFDDQGTAIREKFDSALKWAQQHNRPLFVGEFGAYDKADYDSRVRWTKFVKEELEKRGLPWAYWEFGAGFGIYDREAKAWREELKNALLADE